MTDIASALDDHRWRLGGRMQWHFNAVQKLLYIGLVSVIIVQVRLP